VQYQYDGMSWNVVSAAAGVPGPQGEIGPAGPQGELGPVGPEGADGISVRYMGRVNNYTELEAIRPGAKGGQFYITNDTGEGYFALAIDDPNVVTAWEFMGRLVGQDGAAGAQGETGPAGPQGEAGIQGVQGETGPAGAQGEPGAAGADGAQGPEGPQGIPGLGLRFIARVPTIDDLPATANQGDVYLIEASGDAWVWDETVTAFVNAGPVVGPTGAQGPTGPQGETGPAGAAGAEGPQGIAGPTAVSADAGNISKLGTDGKIFTPATNLSGYLPLAGGAMTGMLGMTGSGTQPLRFGSEPAGNYNLTMLASEGGMQWQFNSDPLFLWSKTSLTAQKPLMLAADPVSELGAATKQYVDTKVASGGTTYTLPTASATVLGGIKVGSGLAIDANGVVSASGGTSGLPLTGGTMTGTIASPIATPMSFMNNYSLFSQNGGVSFRFGAADLIAFSSVGIINYKPMTTPASGIGVQFGSGGGYLAKGGTNGIGAYIGGQLRWTFGSTEHMSTLPIAVSAEATAVNHLVTKSYVDNKPTIISMPAGGTAPDAALYPNNTLLVEYL
jgi:hypothetical protein